MRGLLSILSLFCNEFNKFNNTGAQMLDSIYQDIKITLNSHFGRENGRFCRFLCNVKIDVIT